MGKYVQIIGLISPNWANRVIGIRFNKKYFMEPEFRMNENLKLHSWLFKFSKELREKFKYPCIDFDLINISGGTGGLVTLKNSNTNEISKVINIGIPQSFILITTMMGGEIVYFNDDNPDVKGYPLGNIDNFSQISIPNLEKSWPVNFFIQQYQNTVNKYGKKVVNLFAPIKDGRPQWYIHSPLTLAYRLRGERLFFDMVDQPKLANGILDLALDLGLELFDIYQNQMGIIISEIPIATCIATLISPEIYEKFEIPRLIKIIDRFEKVKIHSCGPSSHIIRLLSKLDKITEIEVGAGTDMSLARKLWPNITLNYLIDTPKFVHNTATEVTKEVSNVMLGAGSGPLIITWPAETGTPIDTIEAIYKTVSKYNQNLEN